ncbi:S-adenosyl-L-methionine-dependent methyltransferase [Wilcoxina mikolae CBS 423.85]|nr:S-adenosyl-L-methionine-dependent methyltransferase [Wilcoxina mikolae CBS 423.85]
MSYTQGSIEIDPAVLTSDDVDDYASSGIAISTESLSSSVNELSIPHLLWPRQELMPTDEKEQDRLDLHHEIMLAMLDGKLHLAPVKEPQRILDIGTGTGIWAIDMADAHPAAEVIATDLSPIQHAWIPPNCKFEVDDAEQQWAFKEVCTRILDETGDMYRCSCCTKPGGYVEFAKLGSDLFSDDNTLTPALMRHCELLNMALAKAGRPQATAASLKAKLEKAGFVDVNVVNVKQPCGPWPKDERMKQIGAMVMLMSETGLEAYCMALFTMVLEMSSEKAMESCRGSMAAIRNKNYHMYSYYHVVYGRKPAEMDRAGRRG